MRIAIYTRGRLTPLLSWLRDFPDTGQIEA